MHYKKYRYFAFFENVFYDVGIRSKKHNEKFHTIKTLIYLPDYSIWIYFVFQKSTSRSLALVM